MFSGPNQYQDFTKVFQQDSNNQIMDIDWEAEWDNLSNDELVAEKNYTEVSSGISEVVRPVPLLIL